MTFTLEPSTLDELPAATPELVLLRVLVEAHIANMEPRDGLRFLNHCVHILREREEASKVVSIRRRNADGAHRANRQALAAFRQILEACVARLSQMEDEDDDMD